MAAEGHWREVPKSRRRAEIAIFSRSLCSKRSPAPIGPRSFGLVILNSRRNDLFAAKKRLSARSERSIVSRFLSLLLLLAPTNASIAGNPGLDNKIQTMLEKSLPRLACNLSNGSPGSIIASPQTDDPNYSFHWIRDSALVAQSLIRLLPYVRDKANETRIREFIEDFATFSDLLQHSPTPHGLGETRFNIDGSIDQSTWPRPQFDGPALRALTLLDYLERSQSNLDFEDRRRDGIDYPRGP